MAQVSADKLENPPVLHQREARRDTRDPRLRAGDAEQGAGGKSLVTHSEPRAPLLVSTLLLARGSKAAISPGSCTAGQCYAWSTSWSS